MNGADPRAGVWYLDQGFLGLTLWGTDETGICRCPKGPACDQKPGKHPITAHGFKDATDDVGRLRLLLSAGSHPNLGVVVPEGCFGWDLDGEDAERVAELERSLGPLPPTMGHDTPNGRHAIYRWAADAPRPDGHILGVVTRWRDNGYLVGASSRIGSKVYRLRRDEQGDVLSIVEFPRAWVEAAIAYRAPARLPAAETPIGHRHPDLVATARHLAGRGVRGDDLMTVLGAINARYPGGSKPEAELREIVDWADKNILDDPEIIVDEPAAFPEPEDRGTASLSALGGVEYVEDLIRPGRIVTWAAEEGSGKSYAVDDELTIRMAIAGGSFAETWPVLRTGPVLVLSEMHTDDDYAREELTLASLELERAALTGRYFRLPLMTAAGGRPALTVPDWCAWVTGWMRDHGVLLLVVDTATGATRVDPWGESIQKVYADLRDLHADGSVLRRGCTGPHRARRHRRSIRW